MRRFCLALLFLAFTTPAYAAEYTVGYDAVWPPLEFMDENNQVCGYTVDYITAVGKEAGFAVRNVHAPWDGIFTGLDRGDLHILASSVTITEERKKNMLFSEPYFETSQILILPYNSSAVKVEDLHGKVIGTQSGTTGQATVNAHKGLNTKLYDDVADAVDELANGKLAGVVCDSHVVMHYLEATAYKGNIKMAPFLLTSQKEYYGFVVKKNNDALMAKINEGMKAVQEKGIDKQIYTKWITQGNLAQ